MALYGSGFYGVGAFGSGVAIAAVQDSAWPPRMIVEATGLTVGDVVTIYRIVAGQRTAIRGGDTVTVGDTSLVLYDGEYSFGVPTTYLVEDNGDDVSTSASITPVLEGGKVAISDAITGLAAEVVITAWPRKTTARASTSFIVGGRTSTVSAPRGDAESQAEVMTQSESSRQQMLALLNGATSGIVLIRQPGGYFGVDGWYQIKSDDEVRITQRGTDERRLWPLDVIDSRGWAPALEAQGWSYADVEAAYEGLTYADLGDDFGTYLDIAVFDWGSL